MCGIAGIVHFDGRPADRDMVESMTRTLAHRGPDGTGMWVEGGIGFGHRRLAIRDLSDSGRQPMTASSGSVVVTYNGEIYNELDLRREIAAAMPIRFVSTCDAELIGPAYALWGTSAVPKLEGMFAFALWDRKTESLILARDPAGVKPLYYAWDGRTLRFASEIKALLVSQLGSAMLSPSAIHRFLAQGYPGPAHTLLEDVFPVPPGSIAVVNAKGLRLERYWTPRRPGDIKDLSAAVEEFGTLFTRVVDETLISDVPLGVLLSGGIDSALIASRLRGRGVRGYTAQFANADYDETSAASSVARKFDLEHESIPVDTGSKVEKRFLEVVHHFDGNCADSSGFALHAVCERARERVPVLLSGDGADEFFGGYETYRATRFAHRLRGLVPAALSRTAGRCLLNSRSDRRLPASEKVARFLLGMAYAHGSTHPQWRRHLYPDTLTRIAGPALSRLVRTSDPLDEYDSAFQAASGATVDRALVADQIYYLPGDLLVKTDAMSMAHGLEIRVPFLDRRIMEFAGRVDADLLTPVFGRDKKILRHALQRAGGDRSIVRAKKRGFNVPVAHHLRHGLRDLGERLLNRADALEPYLAKNAASGLWREHLERRANHGYALWTLLTLAAWRDSAGVQ